MPAPRLALDARQVSLRRQMSQIGLSLVKYASPLDAQCLASEESGKTKHPRKIRNIPSPQGDSPSHGLNLTSPHSRDRLRRITGAAKTLVHDLFPRIIAAKQFPYACSRHWVGIIKATQASQRSRSCSSLHEQTVSCKPLRVHAATAARRFHPTYMRLQAFPTAMYVHA